jgi:hypothetical protein
LTSDGQLQDCGEKILMESGMCFGYSSDGGCVDQNVPNYRNSSQTFEKRNGYFVPLLSPYHVDYNPSISIGDCWARCRSNCSCLGFQWLESNGTGCIFYNGQFEEDGKHDQLYVLTENGMPLTSPTPNPNPTPPPAEKRWWIWIIIAAVAALVVILGFLCFLWIKNPMVRIFLATKY